MTKDQILEALDHIVIELKKLRLEIASLQKKIKKDAKSGQVDIDDALKQLSILSQTMAILLQTTVEWRRMAAEASKKEKVDA